MQYRLSLYSRRRPQKRQNLSSSIGKSFSETTQSKGLLNLILLCFAFRRPSPPVSLEAGGVGVEGQSRSSDNMRTAHGPLWSRIIMRSSPSLHSTCPVQSTSRCVYPSASAASSGVIFGSPTANPSPASLPILQALIYSELIISFSFSAFRLNTLMQCNSHA